MQVSRLTGVEVNRTRALWEEVFSEDSKAFVDFYYTEKAPKNLTLAIGASGSEEADREGIPAAMLHLTPYTMLISGKRYKTYYIVGVATREQYRHQGMMRRLLEEVDIICEENRIPFVFLMPANAKIYSPFGFSYIHVRTRWENLPPKDGARGEMQVRCLADFPAQQPQIYDRLAAFANEQLAQGYDFYIERSAAYFELQQKELAAQNGSIFVLYEEDQLAGYFFQIQENGREIYNELLSRTPLQGVGQTKWDLAKSPEGGFMARTASWYQGAADALFYGKTGFLNEIV